MGLGARRRTWLVVTVLGVVVFLVVTAGTTYSLLDPGYVFEDGELPVEAVILAGCLVLALTGGYRVRVLDRRVLAAAGGLEAWLPPEESTAGTDSVDLGAETRRLRGIARRAAGLAVVWTVLVAGALTGLGLADAAAADLLATGVRVPGIVLEAHTPAKGAPTIWVRYHSPGRSWTEEIDRDSGRDYVAGDPVTVVYDPGDPAHVRTTDEANTNQVVVGFSTVALLLGAGGLPFALGATVGWRRRARAVAATGWRAAAVTVVPDVRRAGLADVHVRYRDGSGIVLRCALSTHGPGELAGQADRRAWIGGWGRRMVVLFPYGPRRPGPHAVPAYAVVSRSLR
ncbi:hypothetical protein [Amycolatopsis sp. NPDC004378]